MFHSGALCERDCCSVGEQVSFLLKTFQNGLHLGGLSSLTHHRAKWDPHKRGHEETCRSRHPPGQRDYLPGPQRVCDGRSCVCFGWENILLCF